MTKIIQRHDTAANWASVNPVLAQGEMGIEDDTRKFKFGDGVTAWTDLAYASSEGGGGGTSYIFTDGIVNNDNTVGLNSNLYSKSFILNTVGTPTLSDKYVGGGFTTSSYFTSKSLLDGTEDSWEMCFKFDFATAGESNQGILDTNTSTGQNIRLTITSDNKLSLRINSDLSSNTYALILTGSTILSINTVYYAKIKYSSSTGYEVYLSTNGIDYTLDASSATTTKLLYSNTVVWTYGKNVVSSAFTGNIYFEDSYIIRNNTERISFVYDYIIADYNKSLNKPMINGVELADNKTSSVLKLEDSFNANLPIVKSVSTDALFVKGSASGNNVILNSLINGSYANNKIQVNSFNTDSFENGYATPTAGAILLPINKAGGFWYGTRNMYTYPSNYYNMMLVSMRSDGKMKVLALLNPPYSTTYNTNQYISSGSYSISGSTVSLGSVLSFASVPSSGTGVSKSCIAYINMQNNTMYIGADSYRQNISQILNYDIVKEATHICLGNYKNVTSNFTYSKNDVFMNNSPLSATNAEVVNNTENLIDITQTVDTRYLSLNVDNSTIKVNESGALEAIAPANMVKLAKITQGDYDALETKDENTMYIVTGDGTVSIYIGSIKIQ